MSLFGKVVAVATAKGALGLVVGVLAVSAASMAGGLSLTGSINPVNWGQQVVQQVDKCKDARASGERGIGQCVSAFAKTHASGARENIPSPSPDSDGNGNGKGHGNANSRGLGNGHGAANPGKGHTK